MVTQSAASALERKLRDSKLTKFQIQVLLAVSKIPKGQTRTYKQIAIAAGRANAYRAVGTALRKNPLAPMIPCHRVIKSDGSLGNYGGAGGIRSKRRMLLAEGALASAKSNIRS